MQTTKATMPKLFIISLPRTGTTSVCASLLELGYTVAHTAYTKQCVENADVIADTPAFCDYPQLDQLYPGSKFIYLQRPLEQWLPSITGLLNRMLKNINNTSGGFNPILKRCFKTTFHPFDEAHINNSQHLSLCYEQHRQAILQYFKDRPYDLLNLDISRADGVQQLLQFINRPEAALKAFPHLNRNQKIIAWNHIKHPNKISSNLPGPEGRKFFDYAKYKTLTV